MSNGWVASAANWIAGLFPQSNQPLAEQPNDFHALAKPLNPPSFQNKEEGRGGHASCSGGVRGGARGGRRGGGDDDDDDDDGPKELFDPKVGSDPKFNYKYNDQKVYKKDDYCYIKDRAGHAGSSYKVYKHSKSKLVLSHSVDKYGDRINKHESNKGHTIKKNDLVGYTRKNKPK